MQCNCFELVVKQRYHVTLCRPAWWGWSRIRCGWALRILLSMSLTPTACPATSSWLNTSMRWLASHWTPEIPAAGGNMIVFVSKPKRSCSLKDRWRYTVNILGCFELDVFLFSSQHMYSCSCDGTVLQWDVTSLTVKKQFNPTCDRLFSIQIYGSTMWCCEYLFTFFFLPTPNEEQLCFFQCWCVCLSVSKISHEPQEDF